MKEQKFNKWFNVFILGGMSACVVLTTLFKLDSSADRALLVIAAVGALAGVASTVLAANGSIWNFLFGTVDVLLYSFILFKNDQPAQLALHLLYILPMEVIGFVKWRRIGLDRDNKVKARRMPGKYWINVAVLYAAVTALMYGLSYFALKSQGVETVYVKTVLDAVITSANIVAFVLMAQAYVEQWYLWIIVNVSSILLWSLTPVLDPGADYALIPLIKYIFYMLNSINGIRVWYRLSGVCELEKNC